MHPALNIVNAFKPLSSLNGVPLVKVFHMKFMAEILWDINSHRIPHIFMKFRETFIEFSVEIFYRYNIMEFLGNRAPWNFRR